MTSPQIQVKGQIKKEHELYTIVFLEENMKKFYRDNGSLEKIIRFRSNGIKHHEDFFKANATLEKTVTYHSNGNKKFETFYRENGTIRKDDRFNTAGKLIGTNYYKANGITPCDPISVKCVSTDPD